MQRKEWRWGDRPKAHKSYTEDGITDITEREYSMAFIRARSRDMPPSAQWTSTQVLTRTLWTKHKESRTARGEENATDEECMNCRDGTEVTRHLMYQCPVAKQAWDAVYRAINQAGTEAMRGNERQPYPIRHNIYQILLYKLPTGIETTQRRDIYDIITATKHILYKLRFRDDPDRIPNTRRLTILIIDDLELMATLKQKNLSKTTILCETIYALRESIGWNH